MSFRAFYWFMAHQFTTDYVADSISLFQQYKRLAEKAIGQCTDEEIFRVLDPESNSIAILVKHMAGNMRSRWTDFLVTDGEKPDRNRDSEFIQDDIASRAQIMQLWDDGWRRVFAAIEPLTAADLDRQVPIRGEPNSVVQAINRQVAHYAHHIGQIVFLAKHFLSADWKTLSVARGRSAEFNAKVAKGEASQR